MTAGLTEGPTSHPSWRPSASLTCLLALYSWGQEVWLSQADVVEP